MALSGRKRLVIYVDNSTAAIIAHLLSELYVFCIFPWYHAIEMALSVSGSSIIIFGNVFRVLCLFKIFISSNVVAPARSSPRASRFQDTASIAPSPLHPSVWISSMNKTISPSAEVTSLPRILRRSSNSPLYLAPQSMLPYQENTRFCLQVFRNISIHTGVPILRQWFPLRFSHKHWLF
jgi:hypothetical protein